jgi:hypothetical protein
MQPQRNRRTRKRREARYHTKYLEKRRIKKNQNELIYFAN